MLPRGVTRTGALARPDKTPFPSQGKTCGRREREADAGPGGGSDPSDPLRTRRWKAPGPRDGVALRGAPSERGAWSVRHSAEVSSSADGRTGDNRCSSDAEEGNVVGSRTKKAWAPDARACNALAPGGRVLHSVRRPVHVNRGSTRGGKPPRGHAVCGATRSGKPGQPGRTGTVAAQDGRSAARHASSAPQGVQQGALKKRKAVSGRRPYEDSESRGRSARTS